jgi:hypothetical protein
MAGKKTPLSPFSKIYVKVMLKTKQISIPVKKTT